jgi:hypothetical protein
MSALCAVLLGSVAANGNTITSMDDSPKPISQRPAQTTIDPTTNPPSELVSAALPGENQSLPVTQPISTAITGNPFTNFPDDTLARFNLGESTTPGNSVTPTAIPLPPPWQTAGIGLLGVLVIGLTKRNRIPRVMRTRTVGQSWA